MFESKNTICEEALKGRKDRVFRDDHKLNHYSAHSEDK